jgi:hypothetical protein
MADSETVTFEEVVAGFEPNLGCDHVEGCDNKAAWFVRYHGCGQYMLCDPHVRTWVKETANALREMKALGCQHCGKIFRSLETVCRVTRL